MERILNFGSENIFKFSLYKKHYYFIKLDLLKFFINNFILIKENIISKFQIKDFLNLG